MLTAEDIGLSQADEALLLRIIAWGDAENNFSEKEVTLIREHLATNHGQYPEMPIEDWRKTIL